MQTYYRTYTSKVNNYHLIKKNQKEAKSELVIVKELIESKEQNLKQIGNKRFSLENMIESAVLQEEMVLLRRKLRKIKKLLEL